MLAKWFGLFDSCKRKPVFSICFLLISSSCQSENTERQSEALLPTTFETIGYRFPYQTPSQEVKALHEQCHKHLNMPDKTKGVQICKDVKEKAPTWLPALYNLAVVESKSGNLKAAGQLLVTALSGDLPTFSIKWKNDKNLENLRKSRFAVDVDNSIEALTRAWRDAIDIGLPLVHWQPPGFSDDEYQRAPPTLLRAGVYLPETSRFIPAGPVTETAIASYLLKTQRQVIVVSARRYPSLNSSLGEVKVQLYDAVTGLSVGDQVSPPKGYEGPNAIELAMDANHVYMRAINSDVSNPELPLSSAWRAMTNKKVAQDITPQIKIVAEGTEVGVLAEEQSENKYRLLFAVGDKNQQWLVSNKSTCAWDTGDFPSPILNHKVEFDDRKGVKITVSEDAGNASAKIHHDGSLLLQLGLQTMLLPSGAASTRQAVALPKGLFLTPPMTEKTCFDL